MMPRASPGIFRNPMIAIFLTGFAMFGAIIVIPLFFRGVLGASATSSGSGQALSRFGGHYRMLGLIGLGIMALGMFMLSHMTVDTPYALAIFNNAVAYRFTAVATDTNSPCGPSGVAGLSANILLAPFAII
jgi:hypothetical protein